MVYYPRQAKVAHPDGLDVRHYLALHHHLFQDVYDWAGTNRSIRIGKDGSWFCFPEHIEGEMEKLFGWLADEGRFQSCPARGLPKRRRAFCRSSMRFIRSGKGTGAADVVFDAACRPCGPAVHRGCA